jgi:subtilisin family serine protease
MAGPHVAGVVALMISANPALSGQVDTITAIIQRTAVPLLTEQECDSITGNVIPNYTYGYGRIDALAAVREALARSSSVVSDHVEYIADIYPNPVRDKFYIDIRRGIGQVSFTLLHPTGQPVIFHTIKASGRILHAFDISLLPSGIYYYRISANKSFQSGKLIKL